MNSYTAELPRLHGAQRMLNALAVVFDIIDINLLRSWCMRLYVQYNTCENPSELCLHDNRAVRRQVRQHMHNSSPRRKQTKDFHGCILHQQLGRIGAAWAMWGSSRQRF